MKTYIEKLVDAFVAWPLPDSASSDQCATIKGYKNRSGTNLLTTQEARQMFEHVLANVQEPNALTLALESIQSDAIACEAKADQMKAKKDELNAYLMSTQAMAHRLDIHRIENAIAAMSQNTPTSEAMRSPKDSSDNSSHSG